jgi:hypothetical protein
LLALGLGISGIAFAAAALLAVGLLLALWLGVAHERKKRIRKAIGDAPIN